MHKKTEDRECTFVYAQQNKLFSKTIYFCIIGYNSINKNFTKNIHKELQVTDLQ